MTHVEQDGMPSVVHCCLCDHPLSVQELNEFFGVMDEGLGGEVHCRRCVQVHLMLCRECSCRYTADAGGICGECAAREYVPAGWEGGLV